MTLRSNDVQSISDDEVSYVGVHSGVSRAAGRNKHRVPPAKRPPDSAGLAQRRTQRSRPTNMDDRAEMRKSGSQKPITADDTGNQQVTPARSRVSNSRAFPVVDLDADSAENPRTAKNRDQTRRQASSTQKSSQSIRSAPQTRTNSNSKTESTERRSTENDIRSDRQRRDQNADEPVLRQRRAPMKRPDPAIQVEDDALMIPKVSSVQATTEKRQPRPPSRPPVPKRSVRLRNIQQRRDVNEVVEESKKLQALDAPFKGPCHFIFKFPPTGRGSIRVTAEERGRLNSCQYLNDTLIDFYIKYLENTLTYRPADKQFTSKFFSSFFFGVLRRGKLGSYKGAKSAIDYDGVKGWTKGVDLFSIEYVFVPICDSYHWSLIIVANLHELQDYLDGKFTEGSAVPRILYFDSLDPKRGQEFGTIMLHYLVEEYLNRKKSEDVSDDLRKETLDRFKKAIPVQKVLVPLQSNEYDCGLYVLNNLSMFLENRDDFTTKLLHGEIEMKNMYSHMDIQNLRIDITTLMTCLEDDWNRKHPKNNDLPTATDGESVAENGKVVDDSQSQEHNAEEEETGEDIDNTASLPLHEFISIPSNRADATSEPKSQEYKSGAQPLQFSNGVQEGISKEGGAPSTSRENGPQITEMKDAMSNHTEEVKEDVAELLDSGKQWHVRIPRDEGRASADIHDVDDHTLPGDPTGDTEMKERNNDGNSDGFLPFYRTSTIHHDGADVTTGEVHQSGMVEDSRTFRGSQFSEVLEEPIHKPMVRSPSEKGFRKEHKLREGHSSRHGKKNPASGYGGGKQFTKGRLKDGRQRRPLRRNGGGESAVDVDMDVGNRRGVKTDAPNVTEIVIDGSAGIDTSSA